jgi:membrane-bound metal-dependent hydrolase YbcI (DUF457 family)
MFVGHFGVALASRRVAPGLSLGTAIFATFLLDAIWPVLVVAGIERVEVKPGITAVNPLDFVHYPWSHSLATAIAWGALFALVYWLVRRDSRNALWLGLIVVSHWVLDWVVHRPDLPLYPGGDGRFGLGVWNSLGLSLALELALFGAGLYLYMASTRARDRTGSIALWALVALLLVAYFSATFGPPPPSAEAVAYSALIGYLLVGWGWWIDRHRAGRMP